MKTFEDFRFLKDLENYSGRDFDILENIGYDLWELKEDMEWNGLDLTYSNLVYFAIRKGLRELEDAINARIEDLESEDDLIESEEKELEALYNLDVDEDFEIVIDGCASSCDCIDHDKDYYEYFKDEIEDFEYNTGFDPIRF